MTWKTRTLIVILATTMLVSSASLAFAQGPIGTEDSPRTVLRGEAIAVSNDGFTLKTLRGREVTVVVTDDTRYRIPGVKDPSLDDMQVGMLAVAQGRWDEDGALIAQRVGAASREDIRRRFARRRAIRRHTIQGEVNTVDLDADTLSVDSRRGEWTVHTTQNTHYRIPGVENPTLADVQVGDRVIVAGKPDTDGRNTGTARLVAVVPKGLVKGRGQVTAVEGEALTLETQRGTYTVATDEATRYRARSIEEPSLDDVQVGNTIIVVGIKQDDGTILARGIGILDPARP